MMVCVCFHRCLQLVASLVLAHGALAHVGLAHLDSDRVVDYAVVDRLGVGAAGHPAVPVLHGILGAEDGRGVVVAALGEFQ